MHIGKKAIILSTFQLAGLIFDGLHTTKRWESRLISQTSPTRNFIAFFCKLLKHFWWSVPWNPWAYDDTDKRVLFVPCKSPFRLLKRALMTSKLLLIVQANL